MTGIDPVSLAITTGLTTMSKIDQQKTAKKNARRRQDAQHAIFMEQQRREERDRKDALKRASAKLRARFGASGISSGSGSAAAILNALSARSAQAGLDQNRLDSIAGSARPNLFDDKYGLAAGIVSDMTPTLGSLIKSFKKKS